MNLKTFTAEIKKVSDHTGKPLTSQQMKMLYEQIKEISDQAFSLIVKEMLVELKMLPSAFPTIGQFLQSWYSYKRARPSTKTQEVTKCVHCRNTGLGTKIINDETTGQGREVMAFCRACDNWRRLFAPSAIISVNDSGVIINTSRLDRPAPSQFIPFVNPEPRKAGTPKERNAKELINNIGRPL
jgi:hypothetical protein